MKNQIEWGNITKGVNKFFDSGAGGGGGGGQKIGGARHKEGWSQFFPKIW